MSLRDPAAASALKLASRALVRAVGGQEAATGYLADAGYHVSQSRVSDWLNVTNAEHQASFMPVLAVAVLESVAHHDAAHPQVTRALARSAGYELVPVNMPAEDSRCWMQHLVGIAGRAGDAASGLADAIGDARRPHVTPAEARALLPQAEALVMAAVELAQALRLHAFDSS